MSTTAYDWRKVIDNIKIADLVKPGNEANFLEMARSLAPGSAWSLDYEGLKTLGPPGGGQKRSFGPSLLSPAMNATSDAQAQKKLGITTVAPANVVELRPNATESDFQGVLNAIYRQLFGNTYVMESERPVNAESLLRNGAISVREFVRKVAKTEAYKERFFYKTSNNRFIELNYKHLLGRAPYDHGEIQEHFGAYHRLGYEAEIDSYIDSDEYHNFFGESVVPYFRGFKYQTFQSAAAFPRLRKLYGGNAGSDTDRASSGQKTLVKTADLLASGQFSKPV
jgi:hypothetical protein